MFLTGFNSLSVLLIFPLSISPYLPLCLIFYFISSNIDEVLLIKPSANMFVFRDFSIYNKGWLTYHVELINLVNLLSSQTVFLKVLLLWISFFLLAPVFVLIKLLSSFHWLSIKFTVKCTFSSHSLWLLVGPVFKIIWEMLHGRISLNLVLLLLIVNCVSGFMLELMYISFIVSDQISLISMVFSCLCYCHIS